ISHAMLSQLAHAQPNWAVWRFPDEVAVATRLVKGRVPLECAPPGYTCRQPQEAFLIASTISPLETIRSDETTFPIPRGRSLVPTQNARSVYSDHGQPRNPLRHLVPPV